jgi:signal transduction histidine kinase
MQLDMLRQDVPVSNTALRDRVGDALKQILDLGRDVQDLSYGLHSSKLQLLGLTEATRALCQHLSQQHSVEIRVRAESVPHDLSQDVSLAVFRVLPGSRSECN